MRIIADGDLKPSDCNPNVGGEDELPAPPNLKTLENEYVRVFACKTTFERAATIEGTIGMFADAADDIGAPTVARRLRKGIEDLGSRLDNGEREAVLNPLRESVLNTAIRFGKARFAQVAARHAEKATGIPKYLEDAVGWLIAP